jgi:hypothetical protein
MTIDDAQHIGDHRGVGGPTGARRKWVATSESGGGTSIVGA